MIQIDDVWKTYHDIKLIKPFKRSEIHGAGTTEQANRKAAVGAKGEQQDFQV